MASDEQLLARAAEGDREAFAALYDRHAPRVLGLLVRMLGQRGDAEDVLQETFLQAWRQAPRFDAGRSPGLAWLFVIARSRALDCLRRRRAPDAPPAATERAAPAEPAGVETLDAALPARAALARLPEEQRSAISLAFFAGMTHEQIALQQGLPIGTVKTRIRRGMIALREYLHSDSRVSA